VSLILVDGGYTGKPFSDEVISELMLKLLNAVSYTDLRLFPNDGLLSVHLLGLKNTEGFGRTVSES